MADRPSDSTITATQSDGLAISQVELRPAGDVMRLARMGAFFPTRLSFMRVLIRRLADEQAQVERRVWEINDEGFGRAVYTVSYGGYTYSLVAFATPLDDDRRTDRVIAEAWDTSYVLFDGIPGQADLDRLQASVPLQEAGRFEATDLVLSRANKSVRLFANVVEQLSRGCQPDEELLGSIGYLMRTTAVYGNGKFGIADRTVIADRPGLGDPFQAEMLTVWLIRGFTHDLVEHIACCKSPQSFQPLDRRLKRFLGIGNATGLGMAPFLVSHPILINNWMIARETALARARTLEQANAAAILRAQALMARARRHLQQWNVDDQRQMSRILILRDELAAIEQLATRDWLAGPRPWNRLVEEASKSSTECQELIVALVLELIADLADGLADCMTSGQVATLDSAMALTQIHDLIDREFSWALAIDFTAHTATQRFWYVSEEKLEPRLGDRYDEPGAKLEMPLDIALRIQALQRDVASALQRGTADTVAGFLARHHEHRYVVRRVQTLASHPYSEIRDNLIGAECLPIDMLRCKLSFFGAAKFDPKSDRWTRITLYQGAPLFDELGQADVDDWWLPVLDHRS